MAIIKGLRLWFGELAVPPWMGRTGDGAAHKAPSTHTAPSGSAGAPGHRPALSRQGGILWPKPLLSPEHLNMPLEKKQTTIFLEKIFVLQTNTRPSADM